MEFLEQVQDLDVIVVPISGKHPQTLRYVALLWALTTPHTILVVGLNQELSHRVTNCESRRLSFQVLELVMRCKRL